MAGRKVLSRENNKTLFYDESAIPKFNEDYQLYSLKPKSDITACEVAEIIALIFDGSQIGKSLHEKLGKRTQRHFKKVE